MIKLLYTEEGLEWAVTIWDEFDKDRRERKRVQNEQDRIIEREEKIWGMGDLN